MVFTKDSDSEGSCGLSEDDSWFCVAKDCVGSVVLISLLLSSS